MRKGRMKSAFVVLAFAVCMWMNGYSGNLIEAREVTVSVQGVPVLTAEISEDKKATANEKAENTAEVSAGEAKNVITDLTQAFDIILQGATSEFVSDYVVDESFLMWLNAQYGDEVIRQLSSCVLDGMMTKDIWYELTGNSIHVLWTEYCKDSGFQSYRLRDVYWQECANPKETVIRFTGDFNLAEDWCTTDLMKSSQNGIEDCMSSDLLEKMQEADILFMNNEFTYSTNGEPLAGKAYTFRAEPLMVKLLSVFGADIVSLANNHVYDYGEAALSDTMACLEEAGVTYLGAGENIKEASKIVYYIANGRKIAFVSATEIERTLNFTREATDSQSGVLKTSSSDQFFRAIEEADKNSDCVIAVVHWGEEGALKYDAAQFRLAEKLVAAGADVIIGGHPHRLQGAGFIKDVPVAYSLGNFWFSTGKLYTAIAQVKISEDGSIKLSYLPCIQEKATTRLITDENETAEFYRYLASVSVKVGIDQEGNVYDKNAGDYPAGDILYDSDTSELEALGARDLEGNVIDVVGNLK